MAACSVGDELGGDWAPGWVSEAGFRWEDLRRRPTLAVALTRTSRNLQRALGTGKYQISEVR